MIRIFSKERKELKTDVDTWVVKWTTYKCEFLSSIQYPKVKECYKAFTDKIKRSVLYGLLGICI